MSVHAAPQLVSAGSLSQKFRGSRLPVLVICVAAVLIGGCGGDTPTNPGGEPAPQATLECETEGYPCSLSEVPLAILERSDALGDSALARLDDGASAAEVAAWLATQSGMAEVQSDDLVVRFRLDGGRGTWILLDGATAVPPPGSGSARSGYAPAGVEQLKTGDGNQGIIVGENLENKRALVLSPFLYEFGEWDVGAAVAEILANTRGYEGRVNHLSNDTQASTEVGVGSFEDWGQYQVVHVTTHGKRVCDAVGCRGIIAATTLEAILPGSGQTAAEKTHSLTQQGLEVTKSQHKPNTTYISVTADFIRALYPSGLDNTVVFLNACQSFASQATDLVEVLQGSSSVVFGWDESVYANDAAAAAVALFNELSEGGYPAKIAYERLGSLRFGSATPHGPAPTLLVGNRPTGGDLRIRDVVTLLEPQTGLALSPSSFVPIEGVENDGLPDGAPYAVRVDGMTPELAGRAVLHVSVDGAEADPVQVSEGASDDHDRWTIEGVVPLGYDLAATTGVTYRAWVELPDQGKSDAETAATLTGDEPIMGRTWELAAVDSAYYTTLPNTPQISTAHLILSFEPGQEASEPNPRYRVTGGSVDFNWNHTVGDCTYSGGITFDVTDEIAGGSHLTFNTTTSPAGYWGYVSTVGPEFSAFEQCGTGEGHTRTHRATDTWMYLPGPDDAQEVSADNRSITGTYRGSAGTYVRVSHYTITRVD